MPTTPWWPRRRRGRPLREIGTRTWLALALAVLAQCTFSIALPQRPVAQAGALPPPLPAGVALFAGLGDPLPVSQLICLSLQASEAGGPAGFAGMDYTVLAGWLSLALELDPHGQYPLLLASHVYAQASDAERQRRMIDLVRAYAGRDLARRWRWLAHVSLVARHRLKDMRLALDLASDLAHAPASVAIPGWARQMAVFLHEELGERRAARVLLGGLLASGTVSDPREARFLVHKLAGLQADEPPSSASVQRRGNP